MALQYKRPQKSEMSRAFRAVTPKSAGEKFSTATDRPASRESLERLALAFNLRRLST